VEGSQQVNVVITETEPVGLLRFRQHDMVFAAPISELARGDDGSIRAAYSFSCTVYERRREHAQRHGAGPAPQTFPNDPEAARLNALVDEMGVPRQGSIEEKALTIYEWMLRNTSVRANLSPPQAARDMGIGHCGQLSRFFIDLCRAAGVDAREACGALARRQPDRGLPHVVVEDYVTPFAHTWPEFWSEASGWVPVDLQTVGHDEQAFNEVSFPDPELRQARLAEGPPYAAYFFGNLDPYRIYSTPWANKLPTITVRSPDGGWRAVGPDVRVRHRLTLEFALA
jgi:hypothetical protein